MVAGSLYSVAEDCDGDGAGELTWSAACGTVGFGGGGGVLVAGDVSAATPVSRMTPVDRNLKLPKGLELDSVLLSAGAGELDIDLLLSWAPNGLACLSNEVLF